MACQLTLTDGVRYRCPLSVTDRRALFAEWCELNGELLSRIEQKALALAAMGHRRISVQYLVEWARYELPIRAVAVPYEDTDGNIRRYGVNNSDCVALGRWLLERHPELPIECRRSVLDEGVAA